MIKTISSVSSAFNLEFSSNHRSLKSTIELDHFLTGLVGLIHTSLTVGRLHIVCTIASTSLSQIGQRSLSTNLFLIRFCRVGKRSCPHFQIKCLIFPGSWSLYFCCQLRSLNYDLEVSPSFYLFIVYCRWYALLTKNFPFTVCPQINLSSAPIRLTCILHMVLASSSLNI